MKYLILILISLFFSGCEDYDMSPVYGPDEALIIHGYDSCKLFNGIMDISLQKSLISKKDFVSIKKTCKSSPGFEGFCYIDYTAKFLNILVKNNVIRKEQFYSIIKNAKNNGGLLVAGYNPFIFAIEILQVFYDNGKITKDEGQKIIDSAEAKKSSECNKICPINH